METYQLYFYKHDGNASNSSNGSFFIAHNGNRSSYDSKLINLTVFDLNYKVPLTKDTFTFIASHAVLVGDFTLPADPSNEDLQQALREHFPHFYL